MSDNPTETGDNGSADARRDLHSEAIHLAQLAVTFDRNQDLEAAVYYYQVWTGHRSTNPRLNPLSRPLGGVQTARPMPGLRSTNSRTRGQESGVQDKSSGAVGSAHE